MALFIASRTKLGIAPSTLNRRLATIRLIHVGAKAATPHDVLEVGEVMRGVRLAWKRPVARARNADGSQTR